MTHTEREIRSTKELLKTVRDNFGEYERFIEYFKEDRGIIFFGCGSSYHLSTVLEHFARRKLGKSVKAVLGSEALLSFESNVGEGEWTVFAFSRSGETTETLKGVEKFRKMGARVIGVTCEKDSTLAKIADDAIVIPSHEESVVMTQSFSGLLYLFTRLIVLASEGDVSSFDNCIESLDLVLETAFAKMIEHDLLKYSLVVFLGTGENWRLSNESALKMKEMALTYAESNSTLDYRHGPKALADDKTLVVIQVEQEEEELVDDLRRELEGYGATVLEIGPAKELEIPCYLERGEDTFLRIVPTQVLALEMAKAKGVNPDTPRNLTKVVKIEGNI